MANLDPNSYTAARLQHATPQHLHITSRRCFIGPVPIGWLKHHRRDWYKHHLHINYSSRSATFHAQPGTGNQRQTSNLENRQRQRTSFPQPAALEEEAEDENGDRVSGRDSASAMIHDPPAVSIPRSSNTDNKPADDAMIEPENIITAESSRPSKPRETFMSPVPTRTRSLPKGQDSRRARPSFRSDAKSNTTRRGSGGALSFVTAKTSLGGQDGYEDEEESGRNSSVNNAASMMTEEHSSTAALIRTRPGSVTTADPAPDAPDGLLDKLKAKVQGFEGTDPATNATTKKRALRSAGVRFTIPEDEANMKGEYLRGKLAQMSRRTTLKRLHRASMQDGGIAKLEKMLVRVEYTEQDIPADFDENDGQKIESRTLDKWKEFMVVCRDVSDDDCEFVLQLYKTRVIKAVEETRVRRSAAYAIKLKRKSTGIGIFSSLDKTIVLWEPFKTGHRYYIMRPRSGASAMEWFTFLRGLLESQKVDLLNISIPDLNVNLVLDHPFDRLERSEDIEKALSGDQDALSRTIREEEAVAQNITKRCLEMLGQAPEWKEIVQTWTAPPRDANTATVQARSLSETSNGVANQTEAQHSSVYQPVGLAWKRYDRLEWVHGENERQMYSTIGMERTHELELRPKQHYPTTIKIDPENSIDEPPPVEGFLIRLTSQRGVEARLGRLFFKRLYFSTHSQYLIFNKPAQAEPPPPPKLPMTENVKVPSSQEIVDKIPLIYSVHPYQLENGKVAWLDDEHPSPAEEVVNHDLDAFDEAERVANLLLKCDGNINLCNVKQVRHVRRGAIPADDNVDDGPEVDFHEDLDEDNDRDDGTVKEFDDERTFELVLQNNLVIRLQAYDKTTKHEWMKRLRALVRYWTLREAADIALYRSVRQQNLRALNIDEDMEALIGQFSRKWEVSHSFASPELYNICGISNCRAITMSGVLYRKPRMRGTFTRNLVILTHGHLLIFADTMRSMTGKQLPHIHNSRLTSFDLRDCYVYSGLITDHDLLYTSRAPDSSSRGAHHGLPRMYTEDGWSSTDEDTMTCFVVWHGNRTGWFRGGDEKKRTKLKKVRQLGVEGRGVVFKCRSRAERDRWVLCVGLEIEKVAGREDVRIVGR